MSLSGADRISPPDWMSPTTPATRLMKNVGELPKPLTELTEVACKDKRAEGKNDWMYEIENIQANVSAVPAMRAQANALRQVGENTR